MLRFETPERRYIRTSDQQDISQPPAPFTSVLPLKVSMDVSEGQLLWDGGRFKGAGGWLIWEYGC